MNHQSCVNLVNSLRLFRGCNRRFFCSSDVIEIPSRVKRSPTDILQALASTVKRDPTAPHYKYHDDPFLIPMSNIGKRTFAMAQEAGRKAAHWIRKEHADLFRHELADPPVKLFQPQMIYNDDSKKVDENTLTSVINDVQISNAITVYRILERDQVKLSDETRQAFLELICFYNGEDVLHEEFIEERWFRQGTRVRDRLRKTWKDGGVAESVFQSKPSSDESYCALIQGMAKYYQADRAWQLYNEAKQNGITLTTDTYNALINVASFLKESYELRWKFVEDLLVSIANEGLKPNLGTLNAVLETLSTMSGYKYTRRCVLQTLAEFKAVGVEPSLASWYFVLITFCRERGGTSYILHDIMNEIQNKAFKIQDFKDTFFFVTAMDVCRNHLNDKELAERVNTLLHFADNYDLMGDSYKESIYYRHYVALLCNAEPLEVFMEHYRRLTPNIYIPEPGIMSEILKAIELNAAIEYVPKMWSDMVLFDHTDRDNLLQAILNIMQQNPPQDNPELTETFSKIAWDIWTKIEEQPVERTKKLNFTGEILGNIMKLSLRANHFQRAALVMDKLDKSAHEVLGVPEIGALTMFIEHCVAQKAPTKALDCIQYCVDNGFNQAGNLAKYLNDSMTLDENHVSRLVGMVGRDVLKGEEEPAA